MELKISQLTKIYGKKIALKDFSSTFTPGIYALLGPNGAGKSTLMNLIAGNLEADAGEITYNGKDTRKMAKDFRAILGYMPQQQGLYEGFSAQRFLYYIAALKGMKKAQSRKEIPELLKKVGLYEECYDKIKGFSGGMKQRLLIAQALLNEPDIIVLDEPTAGLDPKQRILIRNLISEVSINRIVLIATHVVSDIAFIAKEVLLLNKGGLLKSGPIPTLLQSLEGKVFELTVEESDLPKLAPVYKVANVSRVVNDILVRIICDQPPAEYTCHAVAPSLEDVYLDFFEDQGTF